jgi:hypothetical protein
LLPTAFDGAIEAFDEFDVIFRVIESAEILSGVEALDNPAFLIHIGKTKGAFNFSHSLGFTILDDLIEKGLANIEILDKVEPSKTHSFLVPMLVDAMVDDSGDAANDDAVSQGEISLQIAMFERRVLVGKKSSLVADKRRQIGRHIFEKLVRESYKLVKVTATYNFAYFDGAHDSIVLE